MEWIVLLPPVVAIALALWTKEVYLSLFAGIWLGTTILVGGNPILGLRELADQMVAVFQSEGNTRIVIFCLMVGGLMVLVQASGGVQGFINWAQQRGWGTTRRGAELMAWFIGMVIFVESNITALAVGSVSRPLFDRLKLPREKLAFYCDATSAPVCMMIPLNGWGAYLLGLIAAQGMAVGAVGLLVTGLAFNFYAIFAILFTLAMAITGFSYGPMRVAEERARTTGQLLRPGAVPMVSDEVSELPPVAGARLEARNFLIPLGVMVVMIFVGLFITGGGSIMSETASGSTSVLWGVGLAIGAGMLMYAIPRGGKPIMNIRESMGLVLKGSGGLVGVTLLVVFAFALGQVSDALELGPYIVGLLGEDTAAWWLPAAIFLLGCFVSFTLGSSWTAFAILIPIALPLAEGLGISPGLMLGALMSGGVFGDHASPLSDTSIISSLAAASDHVDHINTQLPYALTIAGASLVAFLIAGVLAA